MDGSEYIDAGDLFVLACSIRTGTPKVDLNGDGKTDARDLFLLCNAWGMSVGFGGPLPPNPEDVAPPIDRTVPGDIYRDTEFIFDGTQPIQIGILPGTIEPKRIAILRGRVSARDGTVESGVRISIAGRPEYGFTLTREDGVFDLAVNGGGMLTVVYEKDGFLPIHRQVNVPWRDSVWIPEVALVPFDPVVTTIDFSAPIETARGSVVTDVDGTRQATLLFSQGTEVSIVLPGGATQTLDSISVRATEYTIGPDGQKAMPAELPELTAYTYCAELSADEALAVGADEVLFSMPVHFYVENFVGFPVGTGVPTGFYSRREMRWIGSDDGRVIEILDIAGGKAVLDVAGAGVAATPETLASLGITEPELTELAGLYSSPPVTLWRVPITHFSPCDCNWPVDPPEDAVAPPNDPPEEEEEIDNDCPEEGSLLHVFHQSLRKRIPVPGTPFTLNYNSERVPGYARFSAIKVPLSGETIPGSLRKIILKISVAGETVVEEFDPAPNLTYRFAWDGRDAYGRTVTARYPCDVEVGYRYDLDYSSVSGESSNSWNSIRALGASLWTLPVVNGRSGTSITFWRRWQTMIGGGWDARGAGFGGWTLSAQHHFGPQDLKLYLGTGENVAMDEPFGEIQTFASNLYSPRGIDVAPDGSVYVGVYPPSSVQKIAPDGTPTVFLGGGSSTEDGVPATQARISLGDFQIAPDGCLYFIDLLTTPGARVRKVDADGIVRTLAGGGDPPDGLGDGGPALDAKFNVPTGIAVARDGRVYVCDREDNRVRSFVSWIDTVAGGGPVLFRDDDAVWAESVRFSSPQKIVLAGDTFYFNINNDRILRVIGSGEMTRFAGGGSLRPEGVAPLDAVFYSIKDIARGSKGFYVAEGSSIFRIHRNIVRRIAGTGSSGFSGDGGPPLRAEFYNIQGIAVGPDETLYVCDGGNGRIRMIRPPLPGFLLSGTVLPSPDGRVAFRFNNAGRHAQTREALTGGLIYTLEYDSEGRLSSIEDLTGNRTTIERSAAGSLVSVIAPSGARTQLVVGADEWLESITLPGGETYTMEHTENGLLTAFTNPNGGRSSYTYDEDGLLQRAEDPDGGWKDFAVASAEGVTEATVATRMGRSRSYRIERLDSGETISSVRSCCGGETTTTIATDGTRQTAYPDGTILTELQGADPRWGTVCPFSEDLTITLPSGTFYRMQSERNVLLRPGDDLLDVWTADSSRVVNGNEFQSHYDGDAGTLVETTPAGREIAWRFDDDGRVIEYSYVGLAPTYIVYDGKGRVSVIREGSGEEERTHQLFYTAEGLLQRVVDPLSREASLDYDRSGRITRQTRSDGRELAYGYDGNGNTTSLTLPSGVVYEANYTGLNRRRRFSPPAIGEATADTTAGYDLDGRIAWLRQADGKAIGVSYDSAGRVDSLSTPRGPYAYEYGTAGGNPVRIDSPGGVSLAFAYDGSIPLAETWGGPVEGSVAREYGDGFSTAGMTVNGTAAVEYVYDPDGLLIAAGYETIHRDPVTGLVSGTTLGQVSTSLGYNEFGEVVSCEARFADSCLYNATYTLDGVGRVASSVENVLGSERVVSYGYDAAGRLESVTVDGETVASCTYDANGNRLSVTDAFGETTAAYDIRDRLLELGAASYSYTENGDLAGKSIGTDSTGYEYDVFGNLVAVTLPDGTEIDYVVDGLDRRIGKRRDGLLEQGFLYRDLINPAAELGPSHEVVSRFVYGSRSHVPDYLVQNGGTYAVISDLRGSPRLVVDVAGGQIAQEMDYDVFGKVIRDTNPGFQPFGFAGGLYDRDTGLVRFRHRDYDPEAGRWTARDPIDFSGSVPNLYAYGDGDPVNNVDPLGLWNAPFNKDHCRQWADTYRDEACKISSKRARDIALSQAKKFRENCDYLVDNMESLTAEDIDRTGMDERYAREWEGMRRYVTDGYKNELIRRMKRMQREGRTPEEMSRAATQESIDFVKDFSAKMSESVAQITAAGVAGADTNKW